MPPQKNRRKLLEQNVHFRESPEWHNNVHAVLSLMKRGFSEDQICAVSQIERMHVKKIIEEEEVNKVLIKEHWDNKVPVMKDIIGMGLNGIKETLKEMADPEVRRKMIRGLGDLGALTKIVESLNMLLRLEEGKSTSNTAISHSYSETRVALQELSKIDPVFEYKSELPLVEITEVPK